MRRLDPAVGPPLLLLAWPRRNVSSCGSRARSAPSTGAAGARWTPRSRGGSAQDRCGSGAHDDEVSLPIAGGAQDLSCRISRGLPSEVAHRGQDNPHQANQTRQGKPSPCPIGASRATLVGSAVRLLRVHLAARPGQRGQPHHAAPARLGRRYAEPTSWQYSATNAAAALQVAGSLGLRVYTGSGVTNGPITVSFDDLRATSVSP